MLVTRPWGICPEAIDKQTCDKIIRLGYEKFEPAGTGNETLGNPDDRFKLNSDRISDIAWLTERWLLDLVWNHMLIANENSGWKFDITKCESLQLTRYKEGRFYNFHIDGQGDHLAAYTSNNLRKGLCRKLSMTIVLNSDYEGGQFQFSAYKNEKYAIVMPKNLEKTGSIIVFPSFMEHRVTPVTKGVRYSLVVWFIGPPFK